MYLSSEERDDQLKEFPAEFYLIFARRVARTCPTFYYNWTTSSSKQTKTDFATYVVSHSGTLFAHRLFQKLRRNVTPAKLKLVLLVENCHFFCFEVKRLASFFINLGLGDTEA